MSKWDQYVYSYVPKNAIDPIMEFGLYGGKALLDRPDLLEIAAKNRKESPAKFKNKLEKDLKDPFWKQCFFGPNVVFKLIPDSIVLSKKHPVKKNKLVPIKINLTELLADYPDTKMFGMELKLYKDGIVDGDRRSFLSLKDITKYLAMSAKELWSTYNDIEDRGLYAPDVPHASIHAVSGIVLPKYLKRITRASTIDNLVSLATDFYNSSIT
jgi:hypothetical protein